MARTSSQVNVGCSLLLDFRKCTWRDVPARRILEARQLLPQVSLSSSDTLAKQLGLPTCFQALPVFVLCVQPHQVLTSLLCCVSCYPLLCSWPGVPRPLRRLPTRGRWCSSALPSRPLRRCGWPSSASGTLFVRDKAFVVFRLTRAVTALPATECMACDGCQAETSYMCCVCLMARALGCKVVMWQCSGTLVVQCMVSMAVQSHVVYSGREQWSAAVQARAAAAGPPEQGWPRCMADM